MLLLSRNYLPVTEPDGFHKRLPRDPILSQLNTVLAFTPIFFQDPFQRLSSNQSVQSDVRGFLATIAYAFLTSPRRSDCLPLFLALSKPVVLGEE